jgi:hypothetical protein
MRRVLFAFVLFFSTLQYAAAQSCADLCAACYNAVRADSVYNQQLGAIMQYCNACNSCRQGGGYQSSGCPGGYEACGNVCCGNGNYCSRYGCIARGSIECGGYYCQPGQKCARNGRGCYPEHVVDCGDYSCEPGNKCAIGRRGCLPESTVDCGPKFNQTCDEGRICWVAPADYGSMKKGRLYCPTREEAAKAQAEIKEATDRRKREERERREAAAREAAEKKKEREAARQVAIAQAKQRAQEQAAQRAEEAARKRAEAKARSQLATDDRRRAEEVKRIRARVTAEDRMQSDIVRRLEILANDPKQTSAARRIASIALGNDTKSNQPSGPALAAATTSGGTSLADMMRATMNDPKETPAIRQIAAIGLDADPKALGLPRAASLQQTFSPQQLEFLKSNVVSLQPSGSRLATTSSSGQAAASTLKSNPVTGFTAGSGAPPQQSQSRPANAVDAATAHKTLPYATMSRAAYGEYRQTDIPSPGYASHVDWKTALQQGGASKKMIENYEKAGFSAAIYKSESAKEIVIAYRGSEGNPLSSSEPDWMTNRRARVVGDPSSKLEEQYVAAASLAARVKLQNPEYKVVLTGHSLGGGLASYAGSWTGAEVVTFNAAGNPYSARGNNRNQTNIVVPGDVVGDTQGVLAGIARKRTGQLPGVTMTVPSTSETPGISNLYLRHEINGIIGGLSDVARSK